MLDGKIKLFEKGDVTIEIRPMSDTAGEATLTEEEIEKVLSGDITKEELDRILGVPDLPECTEDCRDVLVPLAEMLVPKGILTEEDKKRAMEMIRAFRKVGGEHSK